MRVPRLSPWLSCFAAIVLICLGASPASAATVTQAKRATRHEVKDRFPNAGFIDVYSCKQLTARRFLCQWDARETTSTAAGQGEAFGKARVTVYQRGSDVRLSGIRCYPRSQYDTSFCDGI